MACLLGSDTLRVVSTSGSVASSEGRPGEWLREVGRGGGTV